MTQAQQTNALRLAEILDKYALNPLREVAAELRRQHARIAELESQLAAIGAGGVEPLRKQAAPAALAVPMAEAWEQSAADTEHQRTGAGLHFNQGIAEGLRICAKDLRAALAAPAHPSEGMPEQTSRDAVIQHLTSAGVLEHDGCGIFIASGDASELIDACMAISATHPTQQGLNAAVRELIDRLQDAQQDINLAANTHMSQQLASAAALLDEVESTLRTLAATQPAAHGMDAQDAARWRHTLEHPAEGVPAQAGPVGYVALAALTSRTHADDYAKCFATEAALLENYPAAKAIAVFDHASTQPAAQGLEAKASQAQRVPLTDEAIRTLYGESDGHWQMVGPQVLCFARSIESAHGIQEQST